MVVLWLKNVSENINEGHQNLNGGFKLHLKAGGKK